jgi:hypothetical protein
LNGRNAIGDTVKAGRHLPPAQFIEFDARHTTTEHAGEESVMTMTYQMNAPCHCQPLASMKARVR